MYYEHGIRFGYRNAEWFVYDPNYDHTKAPIHKTFNKKEDAVDEIFKIIGNQIAVEIASIDPTKEIIFPNYTEFKKNPKLELFTDYGLYMLAKHAPEDVLTILDNAIASKTIDKKSLNNTLATAIQKVDRLQFTALHMLLFYAKDAVLRLIKLSEDSEDLQKSIVTALKSSNKKNIVGIHALLESTPEGLLEIIRLAQQSAIIRQFLADNLLKQDIAGLTTLHKLVKFPEIFSAIISLTQNANDVVPELLYFLTQKNKAGMRGFHLLANNAPEVLQKLLKQMDILNKVSVNTQEKLPEIPLQYQEMIQKEPAALLKYHGFITLAQCLPRKDLNQILQNLNEAEEKILLDRIALEIKNKGVNNYTWLESYARFAPEALLWIIKHSDKQPEMLMSIAQALRIKRADIGSVFHVLILNAPGILPELVKCVDKNPDILEAIIELLPVPNSRNIQAIESLIQEENSKCFIELLKNNLQNKKLLEEICNYLTEKGVHNSTPLQKLFAKNPLLTKELLNLAISSEPLQKAIAKVLNSNNSIGQSGLHHIIYYLPKCIPDLFKLADVSPPISHSIALALQETPFFTSSSVLHFLIAESSQYSQKAIEIILDKNKTLPQIFKVIDFLMKKDQQNISLWFLLDIKDREKIISLLRNSLVHSAKETDIDIKSELEKHATQAKKTVQSNKTTSSGFFDKPSQVSETNLWDELLLEMNSKTFSK